jgi:hypothetical protein
MAGHVPARLTPAEGRRFGLLVGGVFSAIALLFLWRGRPTAAALAGAAGIFLVGMGALLPGHLGPVFRAWMKLALAISMVTTPIVLAILYFVVFTPAGVVMRLVGHNPLEPKPSGPGVWVRREAALRRSNLERQF